MEQTIYADWNGHYVKLTWLSTAELPPPHLVTSVHGVCIENDYVLLAAVANRGFNLPGGHLEQDELPEDTLIRECMEEAYVTLKNISLLGMIQVSHEENPLYDPNGKYPLIGYQLFYKATINERLPYLREFEGQSRIWVEPEQLPFVMNDHALAYTIVKIAFSSE